jgi:hypothetical protein
MTWLAELLSEGTSLNEDEQSYMACHLGLRAQNSQSKTFLSNLTLARADFRPSSPGASESSDPSYPAVGVSLR